MSDVNSLSKEDETQLRKLDYLKAKELMTEDEFISKRTEIFKKYQKVETTSVVVDTKEPSIVPKLPLNNVDFGDTRSKYRSQILVPLSARTPERKEKSKLHDLTTPRTQHINRLDSLIKELQGGTTRNPDGVSSEASSPRFDTPRKMVDEEEIHRKDVEIEKLKAQLDLAQTTNVKVEEKDLKRVLENNLIAYELSLFEKNAEISTLKEKLMSNDIKKEFQSLLFEMDQEKERILVGVETLKVQYEDRIAQLEKQVCELQKV
jgi:hypothetical protein